MLKRLVGLFGGRSPKRGAEEPPLILAVDDDESIRDLLALSFESRGYRVITAVDGAAGIRMAQDHRPDLIVMDANMPVMSGFEAIQRLRQDRRTSDIPVVMLTARWQQGDVITGFRHGVRDYVTKPFIPEEVLKSVETILRDG